MTLIFVVSTFGNSIVVIVVCKKRRMRTFNNLLIFNLAISDLVSSIFCLPLEIPILLNAGKWMYGPVLCPILYPIQTMTIYTTVFTLVVFSLLRYWAILYPFKRQPSVLAAKIVMLSIWVASLSCVVPYIYTLHQSPVTGLCEEDWDDQKSLSYTWSVFVLQYTLPLFIITITYCMIACELRRSVPQDPSPIIRLKQKENRKIVKMLIMLTVTFAICLLPYHLVFFVEQFVWETFPHHDIALSVSYLLLYLNGALNPLLYNRFNTRFRKAFKQLLTRGHSMAQRVSTLGSTALEGLNARRRSSSITFHRRSASFSASKNSSLLSNSSLTSRQKQLLLSRITEAASVDSQLHLSLDACNNNKPYLFKNTLLESPNSMPDVLQLDASPCDAALLSVSESYHKETVL